MERTVDLEYDEIVVGADLSALLYCYRRKVPNIFTRHIRPYEHQLDGNYKKDLEEYNKLFFILSFNGMSPFSDMVQTIRLEDENTLKVATKENGLVNIKFNKLVISDDYKLEGLPQPYSKSTYDNCVVDLIGIDERQVLPDVTIRDERVVNKILFNKSVVRRLRKRFIRVISIISDEELKSPEFSEVYIKLRIERILADILKETRHFKREIFPIGKNLYELPDNIRVLSESLEEIRKVELEENEYINFLESVLWKKL